MAVCSNSIFNTIDVMMQKAALNNYFDFYVSNEDVKMENQIPKCIKKQLQKWD